LGRDLVAHLAVYLVADPEQTNRHLLDDVTAALAGGVTAVQLRVKSLTDRETLALAREIAVRCADRRALFLMNDRVDLALAAGAIGVHLGVDDLPIEDARRLLGPGAVIGYSPETDAQAAEACSRGANYLGVGPVFSTASKSDAGDAIGTETIRRRARLAGIPIIGIGGISSTNAPIVIEAGAVGVAVVGEILRSDDPRAATQRLVSAVNGAFSTL
jgi:thiamine-phosphate pyrophosphorylase